MDENEGKESPDSQNGEVEVNPLKAQSLHEVESTLVNDSLTKLYNNNKEVFTFLINALTKIFLENWAYRRDLVNELLTILGRPAVCEVLFYLMKFKAATVYVLVKETGLSKPAIYSALNLLQNRGLVINAGPISTEGRQARVYSLYNHTTDDLNEAFKRDRLLRTPGYSEVQRITQLILDDYLPLLHSRGYEEIYTAEVMAIIKKTQRGFRSRDLYHPVIENLSERGVSIVSCPTRRIP